MPAYSLQQRTLSFTSPAGEDILLPESLRGVEGISQLFDFELELLADAGTTVNPEAIIGQKVTVRLSAPETGSERFINGIIAGFSRGDSDIHFDSYRARIVPALWVLTLNSNCRIFQTKNVVEILKELFQQYGLSIRIDAQGSYPPLDYCTQYRETDFQFVSRLMEQNGLFYFFVHTADDHQLVIADGRNSYAACPEGSTLRYASGASGEQHIVTDLLLEFNQDSAMVAGKHTRWDYDFRTFATVKTPPVNSGSNFGKIATNERYDYPGTGAGINAASSSPNDLDAAQIAVSALTEDLSSNVFRGVSTGAWLTPGYTMDLTKHPNGPWNRKYLLTQVTHTARQSPSYRGENARPDSYVNNFFALKSDVTYRAPQGIPKPLIAGPQTGVVVGAAGDEIYLDKFGRIHVQFFWDRLGKRDENSSAWLRVAQQWAGSGWGTFYWPRVNDEVIISFLEGDPDHPIVVGSVYNGVNVPPYALPANGTRSGVLTRSSKGGSAENANQLRFEDKKDNEQILIHAEKNMDVSVEHDSMTSVGHDAHLHVAAHQMIAIDGNRSVSVGGSQLENIGRDFDISIGKDLNEKIGGDYLLQTAQNHSHTVGQVYVVDSGQEVHLKGAMKVVIESDMAVCISGPGGFISIDPSGVTIQGMLVKINSGGAQMEGSDATTPSPKNPAAPKAAEGATGPAAASGTSAASGAAGASAGSSPQSGSGTTTARFQPGANAAGAASGTAGSVGAGRSTANEKQAHDNELQPQTTGRPGQSESPGDPGNTVDDSATQRAKDAVQEARGIAQSAEKAENDAEDQAKAAAEAELARIRAAQQQESKDILNTPGAVLTDAEKQAQENAKRAQEIADAAARAVNDPEAEARAQLAAIKAAEEKAAQDEIDRAALAAQKAQDAIDEARRIAQAAEKAEADAEQKAKDIAQKALDNLTGDDD